MPALGERKRGFSLESAPRFVPALPGRSRSAFSRPTFCFLPSSVFLCCSLFRLAVVIGGRKAGFYLGQGLPGALPGGHHRPSSGVSGRTGVTARMATSIMLSSGSKTVSRCTHSPGCRTMWLSRLSDRPHHLRAS